MVDLAVAIGALICYAIIAILLISNEIRSVRRNRKMDKDMEEIMKRIREAQDEAD